MQITPIVQQYSSNTANPRANIKSVPNSYLNNDTVTFGSTGRVGALEIMLQEDAEKISSSYSFKQRAKAKQEEMLKERRPIEEYASALYDIISDFQNEKKIEKSKKYSYAKRYYNEIVMGLYKDAHIWNINTQIVHKADWQSYSIFDFHTRDLISAAAYCALPYVREYADRLTVAKLDNLAKHEDNLRTKIAEQEKILKAKEFIGDNLLQPIIALTKEPELKLPNAIMIESKNVNITNNIINWTLSQAACNKIVVTNDANSSNTLIKNRLKSALEKSRETYNDNSTPTIIYCEHFDRLILDNTSSEVERASIKALLSNTYSKYGATIIFSAEDSSHIDNVIKQPHRMKLINLDRQED